jgi:hypothetical protein
VERGLYIGGGGLGAGDRRWRRPTSEGDSGSEREGVEGACVVSRRQGEIRGGEGGKRGVRRRSRGDHGFIARAIPRGISSLSPGWVSVEWVKGLGEVALGQKEEREGSEGPREGGVRAR